jgi:hypothetical protein
VSLASEDDDETKRQDLILSFLKRHPGIGRDEIMLARKADPELFSPDLAHARNAAIREIQRQVTT